MGGVPSNPKSRAEHDQSDAEADEIFQFSYSVREMVIGGSSNGADGEITTLARAGMATGLAGLFLEAHPDPEKAQCDGPCALRMSQLEPFLAQLKELDTLVKGFKKLDTH